MLVPSFIPRMKSHRSGKTVYVYKHSSTQRHCVCHNQISLIYVGHGLDLDTNDMHIYIYTFIKSNPHQLGNTLHSPAWRCCCCFQRHLPFTTAVLLLLPAVVRSFSISQSAISNEGHKPPPIRRTIQFTGNQSVPLL